MRGTVAAALLMLAACGGGDEDRATPARDGGQPRGDGEVASAASCVEEYSPATLANREFAFDGTVVETGGGTLHADEAGGGGETEGFDTVTFEVNRWYRGGSGDRVTLQTAVPVGAVSSAGSLDLAPGRRFLVAGDGGFAWACGFTQPYSAEVAAEWEAVFEG